MSEGAEVICPHCGAPSWTGYVCCIRAACDERDEVGRVALANAKEIERLRSFLASRDLLLAYDIQREQLRRQPAGYPEEDGK